MTEDYRIIIINQIMLNKFDMLRPEFYIKQEILVSPIKILHQQIFDCTVVSHMHNCEK